MRGEWRIPCRRDQKGLLSSGWLALIGAREGGEKVLFDVGTVLFLDINRRSKYPDAARANCVHVTPADDFVRGGHWSNFDQAIQRDKALTPSQLGCTFIGP